jgi:hypothetical protein
MSRSLKRSTAAAEASASEDASAAKKLDTGKIKSAAASAAKPAKKGTTAKAVKSPPPPLAIYRLTLVSLSDVEWMKKQVFDCYIVVGAVMKGAPTHFEVISSAIPTTLMDLQVEYDRPVLDCVLPVLNQKQMEDRFLGRTDMHTTIAASVREVLCVSSEQ